jgi:hypothetical protein
MFKLYSLKNINKRNYKFFDNFGQRFIFIAFKNPCRVLYEYIYNSAGVEARVGHENAVPVHYMIKKVSIFKFVEDQFE